LGALRLDSPIGSQRTGWSGEDLGCHVVSDILAARYIVIHYRHHTGLRKKERALKFKFKNNLFALAAM